MRRYNPFEAPEPEVWLSLDEAERIRLVEQYHRRARIRMPSTKAHVAIHAVVENQIALGDEIPVQATLERLMSEGLDRHDAIHAIGLVLSEHLYDLVHGSVPAFDPNAAYCAALDRLNAEYWRHSGDHL